MPRRTSHMVLALSVSTLAFAASASAQQQELVPRPASSPLWTLPQPVPGAPPIRSATSEKHDQTVLGLIVGAGLGFAAGWGFYNAMCEAVDNHCAGSRVPSLVFGTSIGAGLGALIGYAAD